ncbi:hypothetical protein ACFLVP_01580 [Chloroflexota bacterium]
MLRAESGKELVRVPIHKLQHREEKALELETPASIALQQSWEMPRRWRVY